MAAAAADTVPGDCRWVTAGALVAVATPGIDAAEETGSYREVGGCVVAEDAEDSGKDVPFGDTFQVEDFVLSRLSAPVFNSSTSTPALSSTHLTHLVDVHFLGQCLTAK